MAENPAPEVSDSLSWSQSVSIRELSGFFLRLGYTAFGGPAAHVAMMEDELVRRRQWLSRQKFLDLLAASNLIPGPSSSELAIYIGYLLAGRAGLLVAGVCFILPATISAQYSKRPFQVPRTGRSFRPVGVRASKCVRRVASRARHSWRGNRFLWFRRSRSGRRGFWGDFLHSARNSQVCYNFPPPIYPAFNLGVTKFTPGA
jgi:hypothetical protein